MFNKSTSVLKKISFLICAFSIIFSCKKEVPLTFEEQHIETSTQANIEINYPIAEGTSKVATLINETIENYLANEINLNEEPIKGLSLEGAIKDFDNEYKTFKEDFNDSTQQWEAQIESEINYESDHIICVTVNSYLDTGGAHGNSHVAFLNFNKKTGELLKQKDIIKDIDGFKSLAESYFQKATKPLTEDQEIEDYFFGEGFKLPENIGFNQEGVIVLYNVYEIASYAQGVTEFVIPYAEAKPFLKINLE